MVGNSRDVLLKLVRIAMGWENHYTLPEDVDWAQVLDMASEQGVEAIVLDGYEILVQKNPSLKGGLNSSENKRILLQAIGQVPIIESTYKQHAEALKELGNVLQQVGVPFLLMKGFSCGQYYPIPSHRPCGDIDIYPGEWFDKSNNSLKEAGIGVDMHYYRHSVSFVKNVMVENHRVLCDLRGPRKQTTAFEKQLEGEAEWSFYSGKQAVVDAEEIPGGKFPTADFNALFLPWHVSAHLEFEIITIRHLLDWALFLTHDGHGIDFAKFKDAKEKYSYGFRRIADILTNLSLRYLNMPTHNIPQGIIEDAVNFDNHLADKVFDYMFAGQPRERDVNVWKFRLNNVRRIWDERWKYTEIYSISMLRFLMLKVKGVLFREGE